MMNIRESINKQSAYSPYSQRSIKRKILDYAFVLFGINFFGYMSGFLHSIMTPSSRVLVKLLNILIVILGLFIYYIVIIGSNIVYIA